jgi:UDP:flavonoid glycosyltransferase YjiC (YdhE family)
MFVIESFALDRSTRRWLEDQLAYLRSAFGLSPRPALDMLARHLYLSRIPSSYQFPGEPLPPVAHLVRPVPFDPPGGDALPGWVHDLPDRPTVYASMGTVFNRVPEVWRAIVDGLSGEPVNLVVTMGGADLPDWPGPLPGNVRIERFVPESALMPYCDLLISHGGIGTILKAMNSGLPVLVIPPAKHHTLHAMRCEALGFGVTLHPPRQLFEDSLVRVPAAIPAGLALPSFVEEGGDDDSSSVLTQTTIRDAVRALLEDDGYRRAAARVQDEIRSMPEPEQAVALLERVADA